MQFVHPRDSKYFPPSPCLLCQFFWSSRSLRSSPFISPLSSPPYLHRASCFESLPDPRPAASRLPSSRLLVPLDPLTGLSLLFVDHAVSAAPAYSHTSSCQISSHFRTVLDAICRGGRPCYSLTRHQSLVSACLSSRRYTGRRGEQEVLKTS